MTLLLGVLLVASAQQQTPVILAVDTLVAGYRSGPRWTPTNNSYGTAFRPLRFYSFGIGVVRGTLEGVKLEDGGDVGGAMLATEKAVGSAHLSGFIPKVPRPVRALSAANARYLGVLRAFLAGQGLKSAKSKIAKLFETDLDGDGTKEVLLEARNREDVATLKAKPTNADYSLIILCRGSNAVPLEFESFAKSQSMELKRIRGVADLDGDGTMEVVTDGEGYEWTNLKLWGYRKGRLTKLLENGAGL